MIKANHKITIPHSLTLKNILKKQQKSRMQPLPPKLDPRSSPFQGLRIPFLEALHRVQEILLQLSNPVNSLSILDLQLHITPLRLFLFDQLILPTLQTFQLQVSTVL